MDSFFIVFKYYWGILFIILLMSYLIGGINFSILATGSKDIRSMGSGNAGFTNVLRSVGKGPAIITFLGDFAKGVLAVWLSGVIIKFIPNLAKNPESVSYILYMSAFFCVLGHIYPCFFGFRGGKGILTGWSVTLLIDFRVFLIVISVFLVLLFIKKIVSLASIFAAAAFPISTFFMLYLDLKNGFGNVYYIMICTLIAFLTSLLVIIKHKSNILRLISGTEGKIVCR